MSLPGLVVLGGLPGSGKTTIARGLAVALGAAHVRVDTIEQAIVSSRVAKQPLGPVGYAIAFGVAHDQLVLGHPVVADAVNPVDETRTAWRAVAAARGARLVEIEIVCSDPVIHRRRAEARTADVPGLVLPSWEEITERTYEPWTDAASRVDTAQLSVDESVGAALEVVRDAWCEAGLSRRE